MRAVKFLNNVALLEIDISDKKWADVRDIQKIRNCVVHQNSIYRQIKRQEMIDIINRIDNISIDNGNEIYLEKDFLDKVITKFDTFFKLIDQSLQEKFTKKKNK